MWQSLWFWIDYSNKTDTRIASHSRIYLYNGEVSVTENVLFILHICVTLAVKMLNKFRKWLILLPVQNSAGLQFFLVFHFPSNLRVVFRFIGYKQESKHSWLQLLHHILLFTKVGKVLRYFYLLKYLQSHLFCLHWQQNGSAIKWILTNSQVCYIRLVIPSQQGLDQDPSCCKCIP